MKVLVVGSGGREHAIAWSLAKSKRTTNIYLAPGNGGTELDDNIENVDIHNNGDLLKFALEKQIDLTVVGPESPLTQGIVDQFRNSKLKIFGPTKNAAQLEGSKEYAKLFMERHKIPTASYRVFTNGEKALEYTKKLKPPIVIKADGLAAGKGVVIAHNHSEANQAIRNFMFEKILGASGNKIVIEEFLQGEELSFIAIADGNNAIPLASSQDHKQLLEGDNGPNTGGMGAYSPASLLTPKLHKDVMTQIINPLIEGMKIDGNPYTGFLYAGLMISPDGSPKVLEFNCRLGDPEAQPILMRLKSDFYDILEKSITNRLTDKDIVWDHRASIGVVLASKGYPANPIFGFKIEDLPENDNNNHVFHAGTKLENGNLVTSGGRVLCITSLGNTLTEARKQAYGIANHIKFQGKQMRNDIGNRGSFGQNAKITELK